MRLLLDTQLLLWALSGSRRLNRTVADRPLSADNEVFFSVASLWEIAIKAGIGRLGADVSEVRQAAIAGGLVELDIRGPHIEAPAGLPHHHRDLSTTCWWPRRIAEPLSLLTADAVLASHGGPVELIKSPAALSPASTHAPGRS